MSDDVTQWRHAQLHKSHTHAVGTTRRTVAHPPHHSAQVVWADGGDTEAAGGHPWQAHGQLRSARVHLTSGPWVHLYKVFVHGVRISTQSVSGRAFGRDYGLTSGEITKLTWSQATDHIRILKFTCRSMFFPWPTQKKNWKFVTNKIIIFAFGAFHDKSVQAWHSHLSDFYENLSMG